MSDDKKKRNITPVHMVPREAGPNSPIERTYRDSVILSNGMTMQELAENDELLEEYSAAQWELYLQKLRNLKKNGS